LRPVVGSPLLDNGINAPPAPPAFPFPSPLQVPLFDPPQRSKLAINGQRPRYVVGGTIDVGALEIAGGTSEPIPLNGSQPLIPPVDFPAGTGVMRGGVMPPADSASGHDARMRVATMVPRHRSVVVVAPRRGMQPSAPANMASISLRPARADKSAARRFRLRSTRPQFATRPSPGPSGHPLPQAERAKHPPSPLAGEGQVRAANAEPAPAKAGGEGRETPLRMSEAIRRVSSFDAGFTGRCLQP
jgi:hypothetical protein